MQSNTVKMKTSANCNDERNVRVNVLFWPRVERGNELWCIEKIKLNKHNKSNHTTNNTWINDTNDALYNTREDGREAWKQQTATNEERCKLKCHKEQLVVVSNAEKEHNYNNFITHTEKLDNDDFHIKTSPEVIKSFADICEDDMHNYTNNVDKLQNWLTDLSVECVNEWKDKLFKNKFVHDVQNVIQSEDKNASNSECISCQEAESMMGEYQNAVKLFFTKVIRKFYTDAALFVECDRKSNTSLHTTKNHEYSDKSTDSVFAHEIKTTSSNLVIACVKSFVCAVCELAKSLSETYNEIKVKWLRVRNEWEKLWQTCSFLLIRLRYVEWWIHLEANNFFNTVWDNRYKIDSKEAEKGNVMKCDCGRISNVESEISDKENIEKCINDETKDCSNNIRIDVNCEHINKKPKSEEFPHTHEHIVSKCNYITLIESEIKLLAKDEEAAHKRILLLLVNKLQEFTLELRNLYETKYVQKRVTTMTRLATITNPKSILYDKHIQSYNTYNKCYNSLPIHRKTSIPTKKFELQKSTLLNYDSVNKMCEEEERIADVQALLLTLNTCLLSSYKLASFSTFDDTNEKNVYFVLLYSLCQLTNEITSFHSITPNVIFCNKHEDDALEFAKFELSVKIIVASTVPLSNYCAFHLEAVQLQIRTELTRYLGRLQIYKTSIIHHNNNNNNNNNNSSNDCNNEYKSNQWEKEITFVTNNDTSWKLSPALYNSAFARLQQLLSLAL